MGTIFSSVIGVVSLIVAGVISAYSASKALKCPKTKAINIWLSVGSFAIAIVMMIVIILML